MAAAVALLLFLSAQGAAPVLGFTRGDFPEDFVFGSATSAYQVTDAPINASVHGFKGFSCVLRSRPIKLVYPRLMDHLDTYRLLFLMISTAV
jgi:hypothetical protein